MNLNAVIWVSMQAQWNIPDDIPEVVKDKTLKIMNEAWKQFKSTLSTDWMDQGKNPVGYYTWLTQEKWEKFVEMKSTDEFKVCKFSKITFFPLSI